MLQCICLSLKNIKAQQPKNEITKQIKRISQFISEITLLGTNKIFEKKKMNLNTVVEYSASLMSYLFESNKNIKMNINLFDEKIMVEMDINQFTKIITNLIKNSMDSIKDQGELIVSTFIHSFEWAAIEIKDTGCGIDKDEKNKIFQPFYTTKSGLKGTGLGLSIVKQIVENHDGIIKVNKNKPKGTIFTVYLPLFQEEI